MVASPAARAVLPPPADRRGIDNDLDTVLLRAMVGLVRSLRRGADLADLRAAILERRLVCAEAPGR